MNPLAKCSGQTRSKTHPDYYEKTKKISKSLKRSHNLEKYFQSSWTKDTIDGGIDKEVFATSKK
ncbi:hypothetical protein [Nostoc sp.]|uniref:hypothetical protein n=1 Tax=Nostoc sp. TaxID=1180 RepID=UPI002FF80759